MIEQLLLIAGAAILALLGTIHLVYTFFTNKFDTHDPAVGEAMKTTSPILTKETTVWKAWVGFNASHSLGAMLIGAFYIPLAISHMEIIRASWWFSLLPMIIGLSYLILAQKYWFSAPFRGILFATISFIAAALFINF